MLPWQHRILDTRVADLGDNQAKELGRFDRRKDEILNAAEALINRHGLRDATLAVIAAEIGLNLKSIRYYFKRREDLAAAAFIRSIDLHQRLAQDALVEDGVEARIRRFVCCYFDMRASVQKGERPEFVHFGDIRALTAPHSDAVWPAYNRMFKAIRQLFRAPEIAWDRAQLNASTHMLLSQLLWSVVWARDYLPEDAPRLAERFCDVLLGGIAATPLDLSAFAASPAAPPPDEADRLSTQSFLRTATALINQLGYRGASVDRISAELNVTKGAFYHHNETRDGLVVACFEHTFALVRQAQDAALMTATNGLSRAAAASVWLVTRQMLENGTLLRTSALTTIGPDLRIKVAWQMSRLTLRFGDMLNDGLIDGSVRPCNVRIAAEMITAMINSAEELGRWVRTASVDNAVELYVRPLFSGLIPTANM
jgi:AcrR family transcriptional regulator